MGTLWDECEAIFLIVVAWWFACFSLDMFDFKMCVRCVIFRETMLSMGIYNFDTFKSIICAPVTLTSILSVIPNTKIIYRVRNIKR